VIKKFSLSLPLPTMKVISKMAKVFYYVFALFWQKLPAGSCRKKISCLLHNPDG